MLGECLFEEAGMRTSSGYHLSSTSVGSTSKPSENPQSDFEECALVYFAGYLYKKCNEKIFAKLAKLGFQAMKM